MNQRLYDLRKEAHAAFDPLWKSGLRSRDGAYMILQDILKLPPEKSHISLLNEQQCLTLIRRLEEGHYWIGAGLRLPSNRKGVWHRGKKQDIYANIHRLRRQQKAMVQNATHGLKLFRKHNPKTDIPRHWKRPTEISTPLVVPQERPTPRNRFSERMHRWWRRLSLQS
jgi:hypothetical protein